MRRATCVTCALAWLVLASVGSASAQTATAGPAGWRAWYPVVSIGGGWAGAESLGAVTADTRASGLGTLTPSPFTLFQTDSTLGNTTRLEIGLAVPVTARIAVEIVGTSARPTLETSIRGDAEGTPPAVASERIDEYTVGARVLYALPRWSLGRRGRPYLAAGGAYLRQLHEARVLVETGQVWTAAAGLRLWLLGAPPGRSLGVTTELGWHWRTGGIALVDGVRGVPTASVRLFAGL
ncbi:MAG: hypothetical protein KA371_15400 [Acidobacteria bacterium]|nr:hypothetical protein [Acidobacteriota bacterium]